MFRKALFAALSVALGLALSGCTSAEVKTMERLKTQGHTQLNAEEIRDLYNNKTQYEKFGLWAIYNQVTGVYPEFAGMTQRKFETLPEASTPMVVTGGLKREIATDPKLSAGCKPVS